MLMYALIGISFVLVGVAGLQFTYLFYIDRVYRERKQYLQKLEKKCAILSKKLELTEQRLAEKEEILAVLASDASKDDEAWADVIGDN